MFSSTVLQARTRLDGNLSWESMVLRVNIIEMPFRETWGEAYYITSHIMQLGRYCLVRNMRLGVVSSKFRNIRRGNGCVRVSQSLLFIMFLFKYDETGSIRCAMYFWYALAPLWENIIKIWVGIYFSNNYLVSDISSKLNI